MWTIMKNRKFMMSEPLESDTIYEATESRYDYYPKDFTLTQCPELVSFSSTRRSESEYAVLGENLQNVVLDFHGATVCLHGIASPVAFYHCQQITLKNLTLEYDRPIFSECRILEVGENYARVHFGPDFPVRCENGRLIPYAPEWEEKRLYCSQTFFQFFDAKTFDGVGITLGLINPSPDKDQDMCFGPVVYTVEACGEDVIFRTVDGQKLRPEWQEGRILAIEHPDREHPAVFLHTCKNVILENIRLLNTCSMGIQPFHTENLYISGLCLRHDEKSKGVICHSADAIHAIACSGDFVLKDSYISGCIDDAVNIHSQFQNVFQASGRTVVLEARARCVTQYANICEIGDLVAFYRGNTMEEKDRAVITGKRVLSAYKCELTFDKNIDTVEGDLVENLSSQANVTFQHNVFAKTNTHIRMQTRGHVLIEDCVTELPILLTGDVDFWYESSPCRDVTIRRTLFSKPRAVISVIPQFNATEKAPFYHQHVKIEDCVFVSTTPLNASFCDDIRFLGNRHSTDAEMQILLSKSGRCVSDTARVVEQE